MPLTKHRQDQVGDPGTVESGGQATQSGGNGIARCRLRIARCRFGQRVYQLAKTLAVYDRADPAAARVVIVAGSDFEGTSPKLFWPETLIYSLPGAELNQMLTLVVAIKSEMPCEPELLLFAGMNDHLHAMGLLEQLKGNEIPTSRKIWEAIQALFAAMNEVQENVVSRFGSKTKVVFTTSPGYANMPPALQFVYAVLILIAEGNEWRILMAAPNREL